MPPSDLVDSRPQTSHPASQIKVDLVAPVLLLLASFASFTSAPSRYLQFGTLDSNIYTSLIYQYDAVVHRFGAVYYATRIAHIFPSSGFVTLFGPSLGYVLHQTLFLFVCTCSIYVIARRVLGRQLAVAFAATMGFAPQLLRPFLWDHYEGSALAYTFVLTALVTTAAYAQSARARSVLMALSGVCLALAINCNPVLVVFCGAVYASYPVLAHRHIWTFAVDTALVLAGFVLTYLLLAWYMSVKYPEFGVFFEATTWKMLIWGLQGGASIWFRSLLPFIYTTGAYYIFVTPLVFAALVGSLIGNKIPPRTLWAAIVQLGVVLAFFVYSYVQGSGLAVTYIYYNVYALPAELFSLIVLMQRFCPREPTRLWRYSILVCLGVILPLLIVRVAIPWFGPETTRSLVVAAAAFLLVAMLGAALYMRALIPLSLLAMVLVVPYASGRGARTNASTIDGYLSGTNAVDERDLRRGTRFLIGLVQRVSPDPREKIAFWYPSRKPYYTAFDAMQSAYLWLYSRATPADPNLQGLPILDPSTKANLSGKAQVYLLGSEHQVEAGLKNLLVEFPKAKVVARGEFNGENLRFSYLCAELAPSSE